MISNTDLRINCPDVEKKIIGFISNNIKQAGLSGAIVAVSGGIDSAVALACSVKALGPKKVTAIHMPEQDVSQKGDVMDVMQHCNRLDVTCNIFDITEILHVMCKNLSFFNSQDKITYGNVKSRIRMVVSYYYANQLKRMVTIFSFTFILSPGGFCAKITQHRFCTNL